MLAQLYTADPSSDVGTTLLVIGALNVVLVIVFLVMASNIAHIRKAADAGLMGMGVGLSAYRFCQYCQMSCPFEASVCHRCGRDIGAWVWHEGVWWTRAQDGGWVWRHERAWHSPDAGHPAPA